MSAIYLSPTVVTLLTAFLLGVVFFCFAAFLRWALRRPSK